MIKLNDKVILVTGGNGLLGKAIVKSVQQHGGKPINLDIAEPSDSSEAYIYADITKQEDVKRAFSKVYEKYGKIDGLVNNAYPRSRDWGIDFEEDIGLSSWKTNVELQMNSYVSCCQQVIKYMRINGHGSIVNMASIYGVVGNDPSLYIGTGIATAAPYTAIKGGLINLTKYLAAKYGSEGIRFNCLSPGGIFDSQNETFVKNYENRVPVGRMGNPDDIGDPVSFLLSDSAKYVTGHNLVVDGGWTIV